MGKEKDMKKRKIIATALMAGIVFSSSSAYAADLTGFKDAPQAGSSAYESLNYAVEKGYLAGIDGELKADKTLTRAELAAIVVRAYGKDAVASNLSQFKDVKKDAWYYEELAKAYSKGYIKGKSATMMAPNETVSQLEALVIIARASGHTGGSQADLAKISEKVPAWAVSNIGSLVKAGVIKADSNGKLNLSAKMTRGNFAGAVYKADKSIDNRTQEDNAKNAKKGDTNNPLDKNGKNPYLPAPGSSSSGGGGGNPPSPSPQGKAERFKAEMGTVPTLRTSIETDKFELEVEEKSKITADRISKALDTEGKKQTYGYIDVSVKTNVDRSSVGKKEAVATLKFNDNSELEVKIPVEVEELPVAYIHPVIKLSNALTGKEFAVGDNLDLSDMKTIVPFVKQLKEDGTWDETSAQAVYVAYKDLGVANIKVVKKGTETEFVNNSPVTADMIEDGKIALEVYKEKIISKDTDAKNRQPIKGLKAKAGTPSPQGKAERFKAEMGTVPTLRTSIETDKFELEVEEKSKITADRISKALDTEGKKQTYGYIDVSVKTNVDRSSVGKKEAVATLKFNDNSELEVKIPVEVEELPVAYIHPVIKLSNALTGKEFAVGDNLDLSDMKTIVPFVKQLKEDGTWDETSAQAVYVAYKDLGVANIKVVKKGTETEFVNNSPVTADMIEDGKIALEVYKEKIISKDTDAKNRQPIKGLKAKASAPALQGHEVVKEFAMERKEIEDRPSAAFLAKYGVYYNDLPNTEPEGQKENYFEIGKDYTVKLDIKISADGKLESITSTTNPSNLGTDARYWNKAKRFFTSLVGKTEDEIKAIKTWRVDVNDKSELDGVSSATITGHAGHLEILEAFKEYRQKNNLG